MAIMGDLNSVYFAHSPFARTLSFTCIYLALLSALFISITDICNKSLINKGVSNFKYTFWTRGVIYSICVILFLLFVMMNPYSDMTNNDTNISDMIRN